VVHEDVHGVLTRSVDDLVKAMGMPGISKMPEGGRVVAVFIGTSFVQDDPEAANKQWRQVRPIASQGPETRGLHG
jgi:hypothetical protein